MRLADIGGEAGFIDRIHETYAGAQGDGLALSLGDDAAVFGVAAGRQVVVTTDMLIEDIHFRRDWSDAYSIGWKAAAVNLSDLAAMGADPTFTFVSLALSPQETVESLDRLYDGLSDCLTRYGSRLAGGDTNSTPDRLVINVTQIGTILDGQALTRSGAKIGDVLLVTGTLGGSAAGLALLSKLGPVKAERFSKALVHCHRRPQPRVVAARAARETGRVHAAMDLSDGLIADVQKLCAASSVGARIDTAHLPLPEGLAEAAAQVGQEALDLALAGGEDFELLLSVAPGSVEAVRAAVAATGTILTAIGEVTRHALRLMAADGETELPLDRHGWDHFIS